MGDLGVEQRFPETDRLEGYRDSELGPLPDDWQVSHIEEVADVRGGKRLPKGHQFSPLPTPYPYIRVVDFHNHSINVNDVRFLSAQDRETIKRYTISSEDLYISIAGTIGLVGHIPNELDGANLTENAAKIVIGDRARVDQRFLVYFLSSDQGQAEISIRTTKTSQPKLALTRIKQIPIPLPPLSEQQAIAHILHIVQEAREATERVIMATRELKRSLMDHLFRYGPVPVDEAEVVPLKETEVGPVPEHWREISFGELMAANELFVKNGYPQGAHNQAGEGVPHLRPFNVTSEGDMDLSQIKYVLPPAEDRPYWIRSGDVIFNNTNSEDLVGKTAFFDLDGSYVLSNHMTIIRVVDRDVVDPQWLAMQMHFLWGRRLFKALCRRHVNQASVSLERLKSVVLYLPPVTEQQKIARILSVVNYKYDAEEDRRQTLNILFKTLLHNLMTGKIRVQDLDLFEVGELV